ncbi:MAG: hypothetical protein WDA42_03655 [Candidatus Bathyarchaeia archaeon]
MATRKYERIARVLEAQKNCLASNNGAWAERHQETLDQILATAPHGSGIDGEGVVLASESTPQRLVFHFDFHHMNERGFYEDWSTYKMVVSPSLTHGFDLRIYGKNKNGIKEYFYDILGQWLNEFDTDI